MNQNVTDLMSANSPALMICIYKVKRNATS